MAVCSTARSPSWLLIAAALPFLFMFVLKPVRSAPTESEDTNALETYDGSGCYYNYQHYGEGDRIITNEPCLNCTCHNRMLMCYLKVCPFTKAIGSDCTVEKRPDQCCPVITCPEVPVQLLDNSPYPSTTLRPVSQHSTAVGHPDTYGCSIDSEFYADGAQVPSDKNKPCELCYCIRNHTACVMQECTLNVEGCKPVYQDGVCCPVRYECEYPDETTTLGTIAGFFFTTTTTMPPNTVCKHNGEEYADGALIQMDDKPCEHCYCMRGEIVCAVQECGTPLEREGHNCTAQPTQPGKCCPEMYQCDGIEYVMDTTNRMNRKQYGYVINDSTQPSITDASSQPEDDVPQLPQHDDQTSGVALNADEAEKQPEPAQTDAPDHVSYTETKPAMESDSLLNDDQVDQQEVTTLSPSLIEEPVEDHAAGQEQVDQHPSEEVQHEPVDQVYEEPVQDIHHDGDDHQIVQDEITPSHEVLPAEPEIVAPAEPAQSVVEDQKETEAEVHTDKPAAPESDEVAKPESDTVSDQVEEIKEQEVQDQKEPEEQEHSTEYVTENVQNAQENDETVPQHEDHKEQDEIQHVPAEIIHDSTPESSTEVSETEDEIPAGTEPSAEQLHEPVETEQSADAGDHEAVTDKVEVYQEPAQQEEEKIPAEIHQEPAGQDEIQHEPVEGDVDDQSHETHPQIQHDPIPSEEEIQHEPIDSEEGVEHEPIHSEEGVQHEPVDESEAPKPEVHEPVEKEPVAHEPVEEIQQVTDQPSVDAESSTEQQLAADAIGSEPAEIESDKAPEQQDSVESETEQSAVVSDHHEDIPSETENKTDEPEKEQEAVVNTEAPVHEPETHDDQNVEHEPVHGEEEHEVHHDDQQSEAVHEPVEEHKEPTPENIDAHQDEQQGEIVHEPVETHEEPQAPENIEIIQDETEQAAPTTSAPASVADEVGSEKETDENAVQMDNLPVEEVSEEKQPEPVHDGEELSEPVDIVTEQPKPAIQNEDESHPVNEPQEITTEPSNEQKPSFDNVETIHQDGQEVPSYDQHETVETEKKPEQEVVNDAGEDHTEAQFEGTEKPEQEQGAEEVPEKTEEPIHADKVEEPVHADHVDEPVHADHVEEPVEEPIHSDDVEKPIDTAEIEEQVHEDGAAYPVPAEPVENHDDHFSVVEVMTKPPMESDSMIHEAESPVNEIEVPEKNVEAPVKEVEVPEKDVEAPVKEVEVPEKDVEAPVKEVEVPEKDVETPVKEVEVVTQEEQDTTVKTPTLGEMIEEISKLPSITNLTPQHPAMQDMEEAEHHYGDEDEHIDSQSDSKEPETEVEDVKESEKPVISDSSVQSSSEEVTEASGEVSTESAEEQTIPGEGDCRVENTVYKNGDKVPVSNNCQQECECKNSIVHCQLQQCPPPPSNDRDCMPIVQEGKCCPTYTCEPQYEIVTDHSAEAVHDGSHEDGSDHAEELTTQGFAPSTEAPSPVAESKPVDFIQDEIASVSQEETKPVSGEQFSHEEIPGQSSHPAQVPAFDGVALDSGDESVHPTIHEDHPAQQPTYDIDQHQQEEHEIEIVTQAASTEAPASAEVTPEAQFDGAEETHHEAEKEPAVSDEIEPQEIFTTAAPASEVSEISQPIGPQSDYVEEAQAEVQTEVPQVSDEVQTDAPVKEEEHVSEPQQHDDVSQPEVPAVDEPQSEISQPEVPAVHDERPTDAVHDEKPVDATVPETTEEAEKEAPPATFAPEQSEPAKPESDAVPQVNEAHESDQAVQNEQVTFTPDTIPETVTAEAEKTPEAPSEQPSDVPEWVKPPTPIGTGFNAEDVQYEAPEQNAEAEISTESSFVAEPIPDIVSEIKPAKPVESADQVKPIEAEQPQEIDNKPVDEQPEHPSEAVHEPIEHIEQNAEEPSEISHEHVESQPEQPSHEPVETHEVEEEKPQEPAEISHEPIEHKPEQHTDEPTEVFNAPVESQPEQPSEEPVTTEAIEQQPEQPAEISYEPVEKHPEGTHEPAEIKPEEPTDAVHEPAEISHEPAEVKPEEPVHESVESQPEHPVGIEHEPVESVPEEPSAQPIESEHEPGDHQPEISTEAVESTAAPEVPSGEQIQHEPEIEHEKEEVYKPEPIPEVQQEPEQHHEIPAGFVPEEHTEQSAEHHVDEHKPKEQTTEHIQEQPEEHKPELHQEQPEEHKPEDHQPEEVPVEQTSEVHHEQPAQVPEEHQPEEHQEQKPEEHSEIIHEQKPVDEASEVPVPVVSEEPKPVVSEEPKPAEPEEESEHGVIDEMYKPEHGLAQFPEMPGLPSYEPFDEMNFPDLPSMPGFDDEQGSFGPGTCRYGGKVYLSAQQIPRDDPCDFCFCFRSDIICLQQSCPPPIKGCHEEAIDGFCCPRYECPVTMALRNASTTTTTTTAAPHVSQFIYEKQNNAGCLVQGELYKIGDEITTASGPCLECRCGGDSKMRCEPKECSPQPLIRKMIEAVSLRR